jgi:DNA integrity scanning protein DisA with diadenylate cyclase activity
MGRLVMNICFKNQCFKTILRELKKLDVEEEHSITFVSCFHSFEDDVLYDTLEEIMDALPIKTKTLTFINESMLVGLIKDGQVSWIPSQILEFEILFEIADYGDFKSHNYMLNKLLKELAIKQIRAGRCLHQTVVNYLDKLGRTMDDLENVLRLLPERE